MCGRRVRPTRYALATEPACNNPTSQAFIAGHDSW